MELLSVRGLTKRYPSFTLDAVSFALEPGYIMGFIGRNGAGKTTTLKSMLGFVHPDAGTVTIAGHDFASEEYAAKQRVGFMFGGVDYYPREKLSTIARVTSRFYPDWDDGAFRRCLERFELDPNKRVRELSAGMKVKFSLAMALSHNAELLLLDEPTSGLDPVSRDDLIALFQQIIADGRHSILFSTHITSDLEKCADFVTFIRKGSIVASTDTESLLASYRLVRGKGDQLTPELARVLHGVKPNAFGFTALIGAKELPLAGGLETAPANLESVMIYLDKEERTL